MALSIDQLLQQARELDQADPLHHFRDQFHIPQHQGRDCVYLCGNSLGLQPKATATYINEALSDWKELAVEGHFKAQNSWMTYHKLLAAPMARVVGAHEHEVVVMNNLTTNLHLLMVSFYQPAGQRYKIIMEAGAFPSDQYAVESQVRFHGYDPSDAIIEVAPRPGETHLRTEDIEQAIADNAGALALVLFGGINYYTGQVFDMRAITQAGHAAGAKVGFDLAHAAGNIELHLHDWGVDFACWCTYKYMNSGPGSVAGAFVHDRWANAPELPRFAGWWGYNEDRRFLMQKGFEPMHGAPGWQLANGTILSMAAVRASVQLFDQATMPALLDKSRRLTSFLARMIEQMDNSGLRIITPAHARGCQLSIVASAGKALFNHLMENGIICDWREPDVIRVAPTPLYNTFEDCVQLVAVLKQFQEQAVTA